MAGPHTELGSGWGLSLGGTREKPKGEPCSFRPEATRLAGEGAPRTGCVAEPSHHLKRAQGTLPTAATYSSGCSQQQGGGSWAGGKGEPREREETQLLLGRSCCPSTRRSKQGQCKPALLRDTKHPCASSPPLNTPQACFTLEHPSRMGCDFSPGLHVKLQITTFIPFPRLLWILPLGSNGHPCPLCHPSMALLPLPQLYPAPAPLTAFASIPRNRDTGQSRLFLALNPALCCLEGKQEHQPTKAQHHNISP